MVIDTASFPKLDELLKKCFKNVLYSDPAPHSRKGLSETSSAEKVLKSRVYSLRIVVNTKLSNGTCAYGELRHYSRFRDCCSVF